MVKFVSVRFPLAVLCGVLAALFPSHAEAGFIINGDFEGPPAGTLVPWMVTSQAGSPGSGGFFADNSFVTPLSGYSTVGPKSGLYYAVSDHDDVFAAALSQTFVVPGPQPSVFLSFSMFVNDQSGAGPIVDPSGLDFTAPSNQHARVDLLRAGADPLSTAAADVLRNFYLGVDPFASNPNPYTDYNFDITAEVGAGGTFMLRFGFVANQGILNMGIDEVDISSGAGIAAIPAPSNLVLLSVGILSLGLFVRLRRRRLLAVARA